MSYALAVDGGGNLYAGGASPPPAAVSANHIAKWDGSAWCALGARDEQLPSMPWRWTAAGTSTPGACFTTAGGVSANHIAKWDGSDWSALGSGTEQRRLRPGGGRQREPVRRRRLHHRRRGARPTTSPSGTAAPGAPWAAGMNGDCRTPWRSTAAGTCTPAATSPPPAGCAANYVARWDGSAWCALGSGDERLRVYALAVDGSGNLYAGGDFTTAGGVRGRPHRQMGRQRLERPGQRGERHCVPCALAVDGSGNLYAGGDFTTAGGVPAEPRRPAGTAAPGAPWAAG